MSQTNLDAPASPSRWTRIGLGLVVSTLVYNLAEALIAIWASVSASSVALLGFGLDSMVEIAAGALLLWRLLLEVRGADAAHLLQVERRVLRWVGGTFIALALVVTGQAVWVLYAGGGPEESLVGLVLAVASLILMPLFAWGKFRAAREMRSKALRAEAKETLACAYLSLTLLLGLGANALWGWWWADPVAGLLMVPWLVREGKEGLLGDDDDDDDEDDDDSDEKSETGKRGENSDEAEAGERGESPNA